jgi:hypothetical protein
MDQTNEADYSHPRLAVQCRSYGDGLCVEMLRSCRRGNIQLDGLLRQKQSDYDSVNEIIGIGDSPLLSEEGTTRLIHTFRQFVHLRNGFYRWLGSGRFRLDLLAARFLGDFRRQAKQSVFELRLYFIGVDFLGKAD